MKHSIWNNLLVSGKEIDLITCKSKSALIKAFTFDQKKISYNFCSIFHQWWCYCRHFVKLYSYNYNWMYIYTFKVENCPFSRVLHNLLWLPGEVCSPRGRGGRCGEFRGGRGQLRVQTVVQWPQLWHRPAPGCDGGGGSHRLPHLQGVWQDQQHGE